MNEALLKVVTSLGSPRVLLAGDFMLDISIYGDAVKISPHAPIPVLRVVKRQFGCGGASFVAADVAAMGGTVICIGVVGNDENGKKLKKMLQGLSADIEGIITAGDRPTIVKNRLIGLAQHKHSQELIRFDDESDEPLCEDELQKILKIYEQKISQCDVVCLQDYNKGLLGEKVCKKMIQIARTNNKKILIDPYPKSDYSKYKNATLITPNRPEASLEVGFEIKTEADAAKAANQLYENLELEAALITLDKKGIYLRSKDDDRNFLIVPRDVYDVSGAGDMVLASLAMTTAAGLDFSTGVQIANIAAGIQVGKLGPASVTIDEIVNEITGGGKILGKGLQAVFNEHRNLGQKIVFTNGCFDILHRGHIEYLTFCKKQGDVLVLGLNSDSSVRAIKGPERPLNNQHDRAAVLAALESVDYITIFDEPDPAELIKKVRPDVLVKGADWAQKGIIGREFVESCGGKVVLAPLVEGKSSTSTIEKIKSLVKKVIE